MFGTSKCVCSSFPLDFFIKYHKKRYSESNSNGFGRNDSYGNKGGYSKPYSAGGYKSGYSNRAPGTGFNKFLQEEKKQNSDEKGNNNLNNSYSSDGHLGENLHDIDYSKEQLKPF